MHNIQTHKLAEQIKSHFAKLTIEKMFRTQGFIDGTEYAKVASYQELKRLDQFFSALATGSHFQDLDDLVRECGLIETLNTKGPHTLMVDPHLPKERGLERRYILDFLVGALEVADPCDLGSPERCELGER